MVECARATVADSSEIRAVLQAYAEHQRRAEDDGDAVTAAIWREAAELLRTLVPVGEGAEQETA